MLTQAVQHKHLPFHAVLMDIFLFVDSLHKIYYSLLKDNCQVDDFGGQKSSRRVDELVWTAHEWKHDKVIKIKSFPKDYKIKLFRVAASTHRTDWVATNDLAQNSPHAAHPLCGMRQKIEQFHRELKQTIDIEKNQCRKARIQRSISPAPCSSGCD